MSSVRTPLRPALVLASTGIAGIAVQTALIRELLGAFGGDELIAALILAAWLAGEAVGAASARRIPQSRTGPLLPFAATVAVLTGLAALPATALIRPLWRLAPGELLPLPALALSAGLLAFFPGAFHSALFVTGANLFSGSAAAGRAYFWRGIGTFVGGLFIWLFLLGRLPAIAIAAGAGLLLFIAAFLFWPRSAPILLLPALVCTGVLISGSSLERRIWSRHWPGQRIRLVRDSPLGKTIAIERAGTTTLLADGVPVATWPTVTSEADELLGRLPLLAHPAPERVLAIGMLPGGLTAELLRNPVRSLQLVVPDRVLLAAVRGFGDSATAAVLTDHRLRIATTDPLQFLQQDTGRYDCIVIAVGPPASLAASRLTTVEFFRRCRARLRPAGVMALPGPALPAAGPLALALLDCRRATLTAAGFGSVLVVPGEPSVLLTSDRPLELTADLVRHRLAARGASALLLEPLLGRLDWPQPPRPGHAPVSSLLLPAERRLALLLTLQQTAPALAAQLVRGGQLAGWLMLTAAAILLALVSLRARRRQQVLRLAVFTSGLAGAAVSVLGVFAMQSATGAAYSGIVLLFAALTAGTTIGAVPGNRLGLRRWRTVAVANLLLFALLFALVPAARGAPLWVFGLLALLGGVALGFVFAVVSRLEPAVAPAGRSGEVAALDLAGGVPGALVLPLLVPVLGLWPTAAFAAAAPLVAGVAVLSAQD